MFPIVCVLGLKSEDPQMHIVDYRFCNKTKKKEKKKISKGGRGNLLFSSYLRNSFNTMDLSGV